MQIFFTWCRVFAVTCLRSEPCKFLMYQSTERYSGRVLRSKLMKNLMSHLFSFFVHFFFGKYMYFSRNVSTKIKFILKWKMIWLETAKVSFYLKTNLNFIVLFWRFILVWNLSSSWPKTAIVDVYNTVYKKWHTSQLSHYKHLRNVNKKTDAWK